MNVYYPHVIDRLLYEILNEDGQVEAFLAKNKQILKYVRKGFEHILREETPWMDAETRVNALEKLGKMKEYIGFLPNTLEDTKLNVEIYGDIEFTAGEGMHWTEMIDQMVRNRQKRNKMDRQIETIETGYDPLEQNAKYITSNQLLINAMNFMEPR
jgi:predicted metalloendopeptidase